MKRFLGILLRLLEGGTTQEPLAVRILPNPRTQQELDREAKATEAKTVNERELTAATRRMAAYSLALVLVAVFQLALFLAQLSLIRRNAIDTRTAAEAARDSAKIARESADIGKLSMVAGNRAYVHEGGFGWISHRNSANGRYFWTLRPRWVNNGNTPTRRLRVFVKYELRDTPLPEDFRFEPPPAVRLVPTSIAPHGTIESAQFDIGGEDLVAVANGRKHFYAWGFAVYRDVFPNTEEHVTRFCTFISRTSGSPLTAYDANKNPFDIVFSYYHRHNCADEECRGAE